MPVFWLDLWLLVWLLHFPDSLADREWKSAFRIKTGTVSVVELLGAEWSGRWPQRAQHAINRDNKFPACEGLRTWLVPTNKRAQLELLQFLFFLICVFIFL